MKRYRVLSFDFDTRATWLKKEIQESWEEKVKEQWKNNKISIMEGLIAEYGAIDAFKKIDNFTKLDSNPASIIAFHNKFFGQIRSAYVIGSFYAALTGACALGERILNHLILRLRGYYKNTDEYKNVYRKDSFDNWDIAINTLEAWSVLLPNAVNSFKELKEIRNKSIHFNPETDSNDEELASEAISKIKQIVDCQFSGFGRQPWFIEGIPGACYVKLSSEEIPFVKEIVIPNCIKVGHLHKLENGHRGWIVHDEHDYADLEISDERFAELANNPSKYDALNNTIQ
jgi:hypothetical protein